ncbi:MAG: hypothetical protein JST92_13645 [Deltaproteobacteria bacterium]|nr:hypothetical protein [Deltaproteobacteria bacterium]
MKTKIIFSLIVLVAAGCELPTKQKTKTLNDAKVPPGFTFSTTRTVNLTLSTAKGLLPKGVGHLTLATKGGKRIMDGALPAKDTDIKFLVPMHETEIVAKLDNGAGQVREVSLPIANGTVKHTFE